MVRGCIRLTRLTLVCEVIRYRLVQVRQNLKKKNFSGWRPAIAFLYLFLFHSLLRLTFFLSQYKSVKRYANMSITLEVGPCTGPGDLTCLMPWKLRLVLGLITFAHLWPLFFFFFGQSFVSCTVHVRVQMTTSCT